jgi:hypothetical protein
MRLFALAILLVCATSFVRAEKSPAIETQWKLKIKVCQGDLKLREQDPAFKMLAAPQVLTLNGSPFTVQVGQAVPTPKVPNVKQHLAEFGIKFQGNVHQLDEQTVQLDLNFQNAELVTGKPDEVEIKSTGVRSIKRLKIGETTTIGLAKTEGKQCWVEVTVDEVPAN